MDNFDGQIIEITNWDKYNPKRAQKSYTWLRLSNNIASDPKLFGLDPDQRYAWIVILCEVSKDNEGKYQLNIPFLEHLTGVSGKKLIHLLEFLTKKGIIRSLHDTTPECSNSNESEQITTPTDGRTDGRTDEDGSEQEISNFQLEDPPSQFQLREKLQQIFQERGVTSEIEKAWLAAYPDPPWVELQILKAIAWEVVNPKKKKKDFPRFINNWLSKDWDAHRAKLPSNRAPPSSGKLKALDELTLEETG